MRIIGTAGHVDHGKSALIAALSGTHPDRLKEEIEREMTIDLGFAWFDLPNGEPLGVIDVPGHRDFIGNMLAGIGGIDGVLLLIAADEGIMPQTSEHLAILDLLEISTGIIVLSKIDLVEDPEWLDLMEMEIHEVLESTSLKNAPIVRVSAKNQQGLNELMLSLQEVLQAQPVRSDLERPRLPIDRIFSMPGFGTIVTGTLSDGSFHVGDAVEVLPDSTIGRIRGLQVHKHKTELANPGSRTAINVSGVNKDQLHRGQVVIKPGSYLPTNLVDARFRLLKDASRAVRHNAKVVFYSGSAEIPATARLMGLDELKPGSEAFVQFKLSEPTIVIRGDHYIIRVPSPAETIGGGVILDPYPQKAHRRYNQSVLTRLNQLLIGTPAELVEQQVMRNTSMKVSDILKQANLPESEGLQLLEEMLSKGVLVQVKGSATGIHAESLLMAATTWQDHVSRITTELQAFHQQNPLLAGMPLENLRNQVVLPAKSLSLILEKLIQEKQLIQQGTMVKLSNYSIQLSDSENQQAQSLLEKFEQHPYSPPDAKECHELIGVDLLHALIDQGKLISISEDILFTPDALEKLTQAVTSHIQQEGSLTLADLRDQFSTSRKYALPVLEYLDKKGVTTRKGEFRVLKDAYK